MTRLPPESTLDVSSSVSDGYKRQGHEALQAKIGTATFIGIGAPTLVETALVLSARLNRDMRGSLARFIEETGTIVIPVSYTHLRAHETVLDLVCRLLLEKKTGIPGIAVKCSYIIKNTDDECRSLSHF